MKTTPIGPCTHCGTQTDGLYSVHKFGFGVGPEVPLCETCLNDVDLGDIWRKNLKGNEAEAVKFMMGDLIA